MAQPVRPASSSTPAVVASRLSKSYPNGGEELQVLKEVDLTIAQGEFVAIMGPSGSGKSTLLNLVGILDRPSGGDLRLMGREVGKLSATQAALARRASLGFIFQSFNLMPRMTALQNVMLPMAIAGVGRRERHDRAVAILRQVGLGDRMKHRPNQLSGGQKQRVAIARALALDPPILLADEPTGNLDSKTGAEIMALFTRLNAAGKTILQVTHDEGVARHAQRIVRFKDGRIAGIESGHARPAPLVFEELGHVPAWSGAAAAQPAWEPSPEPSRRRLRKAEKAEKAEKAQNARKKGPVPVAAPGTKPYTPVRPKWASGHGPGEGWK